MIRGQGMGFTCGLVELTMLGSTPPCFQQGDLCTRNSRPNAEGPQYQGPMKMVFNDFNFFLNHKKKSNVRVKEIVILLYQ